MQSYKVVDISQCLIFLYNHTYGRGKNMNINGRDKTRGTFFVKHLLSDDLSYDGPLISNGLWVKL